MAYQHTDVGGRSAIFQITVTLVGDVPRNTNGSATVSNTGAEVANVAGLVTTSQSQFVILSVHSNVLVMAKRELLDGSFNGLHAARLTHLLGGEVGMAASTVPIALEGLGVEGNLYAPLFSNADQEITSHPKVVSHLNAFARPNLELPLGGHYLGVDAADLDTGIEAGTVVSLDQVTSEDFAGT